MSFEPSDPPNPAKPRYRTIWAMMSITCIVAMYLASQRPARISVTNVWTVWVLGLLVPWAVVLLIPWVAGPIRFKRVLWYSPSSEVEILEWLS
jgi:hypothetical protein